MNKPVLIASTLAGAATALLIGATTAQAAGGLQDQPLRCDNGQQITVQTNVNSSNDAGGWEAVKVVSGGSGRLIPTSIEFSAYDDTIQAPVFDGIEVKGAGHALLSEPTVTCSDSEHTTLGDLLQPGDDLPPGGSPSDQVTVTITAVAVWQH